MTVGLLLATLVTCSGWMAARLPSPTWQWRSRANVAGSSAKFAVEVDLGPDGEPKGKQRLLFSPMLNASEVRQFTAST